MAETDVILLGGGLANGLIAWWLHRLRPEVRVTLIEQGAALGGRHTWSFYASDLDAAQRAIMDPLIAARWEGYDVRFPAYHRRLHTPYASLTSASLHQALASLSSHKIRLNSYGDITSPTRVTMQNGEMLSAPLVIDGRGWDTTPHFALAYQKFVGLEVRTRTPHGEQYPVIMDATVPQKDGYRFFYTLPFAADRLLIEDTRYSASRALDIPAMRSDIEEYARAKGWAISEVIGEESGVLPITLDGRFEAFQREKRHTVVGLRAGLFHPTTGYSLLDAVRIADAIAQLSALNNAHVQALVWRYATRQWRARHFFRLLNRMLFLAAEPTMRYKVLERFYRLPQARIERFYAGTLTWADRAALLVGKPPVSIWRAVASFPAASAWQKKEGAQ